MAGAGCFVEWCSRSHSLPGKASQSELGRGWVVVKTKASCPWLGAHNGAPRSATAELSNAFLFRLRNWQINSSRLTFKYLRQEWEMEFFFPLKLLLNEMQSCFWLEWSNRWLEQAELRKGHRSYKPLKPFKPSITKSILNLGQSPLFISNLIALFLSLNTILTHKLTPSRYDNFLTFSYLDLDTLMHNVKFKSPFLSPSSL